MLKHGLIDNEENYNRLLSYRIEDADSGRLLSLLRESVMVKRRIVEEDPHEHGIRRALNLGHTAGHAFESPQCVVATRFPTDMRLHGDAWSNLCSAI